jgi:hypothetical protein
MTSQLLKTSKSHPWKHTTLHDFKNSPKILALDIRFQHQGRVYQQFYSLQTTKKESLAKLNSIIVPEFKNCRVFL